MHLGGGGNRFEGSGSGCMDFCSRQQESLSPEDKTKLLTAYSLRASWIWVFTTSLLNKGKLS